MSGATSRVHYFHADANALGGQLTQPESKMVPIQAPISLPTVGGSGIARAPLYNLDSILSFDSAESQVSGSVTQGRPSWTTSASSSIATLNVLNILQVKQMVVHMKAEHPQQSGQQTPSLTLAGTSFPILQLGNHSVTVTLDFGPYAVQDGGLYPAVGPLNDDAFLQWAFSTQSGAHSSDPAAQAAALKAFKAAAQTRNSVLCSIVKTVTIDETTEPFPGTVDRYVITYPGLGVISLGEFIVDDNSFHLTMIRIDLDTSVPGSTKSGMQGQVGILSAHVNGTTQP